MSGSHSPSPKWDITEEDFSRFMRWLNPDRDRAGEKYEEIRHRLIRIFACRGCSCPEELADETINRVIRKVQEIGQNYVGEQALYFYGVAHRVHLEYLRRKPHSELPVIADSSVRPEAEYLCLEQCLNRLTPRSRDLVLQYHREEKHAKIDLRKEQAKSLGIQLNALRIRAYRIRANLEHCMVECLKKRGGQVK